ncbi:MAG: response regulator [Pontiellaceae bacterium]|nr:response regulator [Pontiellaceae bacterium]
MRLKNSSLYSFVALALALLFLFYSGLVIKHTHREIDLYQAAQMGNMQGQIDASLHDYHRFSNYIFDEIINQEAVTSVFAAAKDAPEAERDALRQNLHAMLKPRYETMVQYSFRQLHFHFPNSVSFLRMHRPEKYGDSLAGIRYSVEKANELRLNVAGFEEGRIFNGFRYVYPLSRAQEHLGTVELSISAETILKTLYNLYPYTTVYFIIRDDVVEQNVFESERDNYVPSNLIDGYSFDVSVHRVVNEREHQVLGAASAPLKKAICSKIGIQTDFHEARNITVAHAGKNYLVQIHPIIGVSGQQVAAFVSVAEDMMISAAKHEMKMRLLFSGIVFALLLGAVFLLFIYHHRLVITQHRADDANAVKSRFLANMSHEIRTPIGGIKGILALMEYTDLNTEQKEYVELAESSADLLLGVINEILDISKIESGELVLEAKAFRVRPFIENAVNLFLPAAKDQGIQLLCNIAPEIQEVLVGDPLKIHQILNNLISNALKFTLKGEITLQVSLLQRMEDGRSELQFVVSDTGIGMNDSVQKKVFDPFVQAESSTTRKYGGTGLGLPITRELIRRMGGDISVESRPNEGTKMCFSIVLEPWDETGEVLDPTPIQRKSGHAPLPPGKCPKILIAEDSLVNRKILEKLLTREGYTADMVVNGEDAVSAAEKKVYDLIFMDCQMPLMDGYEATRRIRQSEPADRHTKIVALTAHAFKGEEDKCLAAGMDAYLSKPFELSAILKEIQSVSS